MNWREAEREYTDDVIGETNLARLFEDAAERYLDRPAQLYKGGTYDRSLAPGVVPEAPAGDYAELTYDEMRETVRNLAAGFRDLGVEAGDRVGIFAETRMEWAQADLGLLAAGGVVTTVYKDSTPSQVQYLLGDPGASGVVVENGDLLERVLDVEDDLDLEFVVVMDEVETDREDVHTLAAVHDRGKDNYDHEAYQRWIDDRDLDDLATLVYTSGTTGRPKGVQLTHGNLRANVDQVRKRYGPRPDKPADVPVTDETSRAVSYLPLAHIFERLAGHFFMFASGAAVAYAESPDTLQEDFQLVRPTTVTSVPRVYEKIYDAIREQATESALKARIFEWATGVGRAYHEADSSGPLLEGKRWLADRLVFEKVREGLGGNVEMMISGGGSLSPELCALYHGMGLPIFEGYGLTETSPVVSTNPPEEPKIGTIGPPVPDVEVRIDEGVILDDQFPGAEGEGYWDKPAETEAAFADGEAQVTDGGSDAEGDGRWFRTGDIVERRPDGSLVFRERAKQLLVLSTGKNVAPGPIEDKFAASPVVEQAMVVGDGRKFVAALVVPNVERLRKWAEEGGFELPADRAAICEDEPVRERIQQAVDAANEDLQPHETIKKFTLVPEEFTQENDLLTPSMKKKRRNIREHYGDEIDALYGD
ncbi:long-chain fatty acid--CoA ligase [Halobacteriales archaeon QS_1_68_20]|nr:MAG: long-chain fatty acid--CoA ligase [Halobacteriales archaeon QS_1_68_20]